MGDVVPFGRKPVKSQWTLITLEDAEAGPGYLVRAWDGDPDDPFAENLLLGECATLVESASFARGKAAELGVRNFADRRTHIPRIPDPANGGDAA
jgi:hypothetical protein